MVKTDGSISLITVVYPNIRSVFVKKELKFILQIILFAELYILNNDLDFLKNDIYSRGINDKITIGTTAITTQLLSCNYNKYTKEVSIYFVIIGNRKSGEVIYIIDQEYRASFNNVSGIATIILEDGTVINGICIIDYTNGYIYQNSTNESTRSIAAHFRYYIE